MGMIFAGEKFDLRDNSKISKINSPKEHVTGQPFVLYKDYINRFVIVALEYDGNPRLGIRHFWDTSGYPCRARTATWLLIPPEMNSFIVNFVTRNWNIFRWFFCSRLINSFLSRKINIKKLAERWK